MLKNFTNKPIYAQQAFLIELLRISNYNKMIELNKKKKLYTLNFLLMYCKLQKLRRLNKNNNLFVLFWTQYFNFKWWLKKKIIFNIRENCFFKLFKTPLRAYKKKIYIKKYKIIKKFFIKNFLINNFYKLKLYQKKLHKKKFHQKILYKKKLYKKKLYKKNWYKKKFKKLKKKKFFHWKKLKKFKNYFLTNNFLKFINRYTLNFISFKLKIYLKKFKFISLHHFIKQLITFYYN